MEKMAKQVLVSRFKLFIFKLRKKSECLSLPFSIAQKEGSTTKKKTTLPLLHNIMLGQKS